MIHNKWFFPESTGVLAERSYQETVFIVIQLKGRLNMNVYGINFNPKTFKIEANVHQIEYNNLDEQYEKLVKLLNADGLDVVDYNNDIAILVDDRGFEKQYNPVFEVITEDNISCQLSGKILFVRNIYNQESTDFGGVTPEDVFYLKNNLQITLKGVLENPL